MTTLTNRPNTALMVIDVQNGVVAGSHDRDGVVANITALVDRARAEDVPVVWVQHSDEGLEQGSDDWQHRRRARAGRRRAGRAQALRRLVRGHRPRGASWPPGASAGSSSPARRATPASGRPCTARSSGATTSRWSATRTPPRTSRAVRRAVTRPGHRAHQPLLVVVQRASAGAATWSRRPRSTSRAVRFDRFRAADRIRARFRSSDRALQPNP